MSNDLDHRMEEVEEHISDLLVEMARMKRALRAFRQTRCTAEEVERNKPEAPKKKVTLVSRILDLVDDSTPLTTKEITATLKEKENSVRSTLYGLKRRGFVLKISDKWLASIE